MDMHNDGTESLSRPKIIVGQASTPSESSATRRWRGIELGLYSEWGAPRLVAEYPYHSVTLQLKGTRRVVQRRYGQTLDQVTRAGCLIVTPSGGPKEWRTYGEPGCEFVVINLSSRLCDELLSDDGGGRLSPVGFRDHFGGRDIRLDALIRSLLNEYRENEMASRLYVDLLRQQLVLHLARRYSISSVALPRRHPKLDETKLHRVLDFIESNLDAELTHDSLSREVGVSASRFAHMFREAVGVAPHRYVLRRRIERGCSLLLKSHYTVSQVAFETGFSSPSHFCKAFFNVTQTTPGEYRRRYG